MTNKQWTKELVQQHAQTAVAVELYTLPFYLTVLSSINLNAPKYDGCNQKEYDAKAAGSAKAIYQAILSVCLEEMLHLQLAANLCRALDTSPNFTAPKYGTPIPFLKPDDPATGHNILVNAVLGGLNETTLQMMLDIETPTEFEEDSHTSPNYPYHTLGDMYNALLRGIEIVGKEQFSWKTTYQREIFTYGPKFDKNDLQISQTIGNLEQAQDAIYLINAQGEGQPKKRAELPTKPYKEEDFLVPEKYRFIFYKDDGKKVDSEKDDPRKLNKYSHFGRFIWVQNQIKANGYPEVYPLKQSQDELDNVRSATAYTMLMTGFSDLLGTLNYMWSIKNKEDTGDFWTIMPQLIKLPRNCWESGVIPKWSL